jgi:hypothetical protein
VTTSEAVSSSESDSGSVLGAVRAENGDQSSQNGQQGRVLGTKRGQVKTGDAGMALMDAAAAGLSGVLLSVWKNFRRKKK